MLDRVRPGGRGAAIAASHEVVENNIVPMVQESSVTKLRAFGMLGLAALVTAGCAAGPPPSATASSSAAHPMSEAPKLSSGYLAKADRPDSLKFVPPPPAAGSAAQARDDAAAKAAVALQGGDRWRLATRDADLRMPQAAAQAFSCALGVQMTPEKAPRLMSLLSRTLSDLGLSTYGAKTKYMRPRPFTVDGAPTCTPQFENVLRHDGSYPSGHSAAGWGWALILAEIAPDRADAVLSRGRAFGQSRVVCNVHWQSDTEEGRIVAAAVVARLHANPEFRADLEAARDELAALRQGGAAPAQDCAAEAAILANG
jgi:acid phosphatase (class A)